MARRTTSVATLALALLSGCGGSSGGGAVANGGGLPPSPSAPPSPNPPPSPSPSAPPTFTFVHPVLPPGQPAQEGDFATSHTCASCHSNAPAAAAMRDGQGRGVAPLDLWQASMKANAVRDPLFRAQLSAELEATPSLAVAIQDKCLTCHAPMAQTNSLTGGADLTLASLTVDQPRTHLAVDGVSCTLCHALQPLRPDQAPATFDGHYPLAGGRDLFGPYPNPFATPMQVNTGYRPVEGSHLRSSTLCSSCHTLYTTAVDGNGLPTGGKLPEQTPYLEWQNSVFNDEVATPDARAASCQACHLPQDDVDGDAITTAVARTPGGQDWNVLGPRSPFGRHLFVGGNTLIPAILRDQRAELNPTASDAAFDEVIARAREQLQERTARLALGPSSRSGDVVTIPVTVTNLAGHKLPSGYPSRRAWLRVRVRDAQGQLVFASGEHDAQGRLVDGAGSPLASERAGGPTQRHREVVEGPEQVQVYEAVMSDAAGLPTYRLLRAERYLKDNRLLPLGWSPGHPDAAETAPQGVAGDADFRDGQDVVALRFRAPAGAGPYQVEVTLLYQTLGARFADELFLAQTAEVQAFRDYYAAADRTPERLAMATASVP